MKVIIAPDSFNQGDRGNFLHDFRLNSGKYFLGESVEAGNSHF